MRERASRASSTSSQASLTWRASRNATSPVSEAIESAAAVGDDKIEHADGKPWAKLGSRLCREMRFSFGGEGDGARFHRACGKVCWKNSQQAFLLRASPGSGLVCAANGRPRFLSVTKGRAAKMTTSIFSFPRGNSYLRGAPLQCGPSLPTPPSGVANLWMRRGAGHAARTETSSETAADCLFGGLSVCLGCVAVGDVRA